MGQEQSYDIIGDIHGDADRLKVILASLGYDDRAGAWRAPSGRKAAFLGDFIDTGTQNREVISIVRKMLEAGQAVAILGNHELNALLYHTPGQNSLNHPCGYMRAHDAINMQQHRSFIAEFPVGSPNTREALQFFSELPLFLDLGGLRLAHASWSNRFVARIRERRIDGRIHEEDLQALACEDKTDPFVEAVLALLKGPEAPLPDGYSFHDHARHERFRIRTRWWSDNASNWRDIAASVPDLSELPDGRFDPELVDIPDPGNVPVAFGHYKRKGPVRLDAPLAICLDYPGIPLAYRWDGETSFDLKKVVQAVDVSDKLLPEVLF